MDNKPADNKPAGAGPTTGPSARPAGEGVTHAAQDTTKQDTSKAASNTLPRAEILEAPEVTASGPATPNRDRPRTGPLIDAAPGDVRREETTAKPVADKKPDTKSAPATSEKSSPDKPGAGIAGILAPLLAGVAGAVVALAGAGGYSWLTTPDAAKTAAAQSEQMRSLVETSAGKERAAFETKLKGEQERLDKQSTAMSTALAALSQRIAAVESLGGQAASAAGVAREDITRLLAKPLPTSVDIGPFETRVSALEKRLALAEAALAAPKSEVRATEDRSVAPQLPASPATPAAAPTVIALPDLAPLQQRLAQLEARPQPRPADLTPLQARLSALEERLAPLARQIEPLAARLAPMEKQVAPLLAGLDKAQAQTAANAQAITQGRTQSAAAALAVVSRSMADALRTGAPYANLLQAAQALGAEPAQVDALKPFAENGAPDAPALLKSLALAEQKIVQRKPAPPPADEPLLDKLKRNLMQQVQIKPLDSAGQIAPGGSLAALAEAVKRGELARAVKLADILPEPAAKPLAPWISQLRQVAAAHAAAQSLQSSALARLTQERSQ